MNLLRPLLPSALLLTLLPLPLHATGDYWTAPSYLDGSGKVLKSAPEFFWHLELKRLAEKFRDKDLPSPSPAPKTAAADESDPNAADEQAKSYLVAQDRDDFADALKTGRLKPADPAAATKANAAARAAINSDRVVETDPVDPDSKDKPAKPAPVPAAPKDPPPAEAESEFADYHKGAALEVADKAAAAAWEKLLARPAAERHYRSVWAAYMLGRHALTLKNWTEAVKRFVECRALAKEGFADSAHLAADSYGWEARAELLQAHYPKAARLYLNQLALGDESAIVSLKRIIPGVTSLYSEGPPGGVPGEEPREIGDDDKTPPPSEGPAEDAAALKARWLAAAKDPVVQELVTAHILATDTAEYAGETTRGKEWLAVLTEAGLEKSTDADRLAWLAYNAGDYNAAHAWLAKADAKSPLSQWLEAKFALRDGKLEEAGKIMPAVAESMPAVENAEFLVTPHDRSRGELGALLYSKGQYPEAFAAFLEGNATEDLRFLIESVLTTEELLTIATKVPRPKPPKKDAEGNELSPETHSNGVWVWKAPEIASQIGRRLVRDGKVKEGRALLSEEEQKFMDEYVASAVKAEDKNVSALDRAKAWWAAADAMMDNGHYFRGTEEDFHKPREEGDVSDFTVRSQRVTGKYNPQSFEENEKQAPRPIFIPVSEVEKKRLAATAKQHTKVTRTRMVAVNHLLKAADLLPDKSEERARTLNTAGYWLQDLDNPAADKIYARLKNGFAETPTGKAAIKKKWFTGYSNPWKKADPDGAEER